MQIELDIFVFELDIFVPLNIWTWYFGLNLIFTLDIALLHFDIFVLHRMPCKHNTRCNVTAHTGTLVLQLKMLVHCTLEQWILMYQFRTVNRQKMNLSHSVWSCAIFKRSYAGRDSGLNQRIISVPLVMPVWYIYLYIALVMLSHFLCAHIFKALYFLSSQSTFLSVCHSVTQSFMLSICMYAPVHFLIKYLYLSDSAS